MNNGTEPNNIKNTPFIIPDNYFDKLEDSILQKTLGQEEPKKILPFSTPDDYFIHLEENILKKNIQENKKQKGKIISLFTKRTYIISAAACLIIAVTIAFYALTSNNTRTKNIAVAHQPDFLSDTLQDKLYVGKKDEVKESKLKPYPAPEKESKNSYVSNDNKTKTTIKAQNKKISATAMANKEKRTSEIIYKLYFADDFPELEEEYF